jgi:hypothetical protein
LLQPEISMYLFASYSQRLHYFLFSTKWPRSSQIAGSILVEQLLARLGRQMPNNATDPLLACEVWVKLQISEIVRLNLHGSIVPVLRGKLSCNWSERIEKSN